MRNDGVERKRTSLILTALINHVKAKSHVGIFLASRARETLLSRLLVNPNSKSTYSGKGSRSRLVGGRGVFLFVAFLLVCSELLMGVMPVQKGVFSSYSEPRNPLFLRGWVEYTAVPKQEQKGFRVIIISNSQGFLRECTEGELCYSQQLEGLLRTNGYGLDADVLNWSVPGGTCLEEILLAARSVEHQPDVVILASYNNDFSPDWEQESLDSMRSDIQSLAYLPAVRQHLPQQLLSSMGAFNIREWLRANSRLMEWNHRFVGPDRFWSVRQMPQSQMIGTEYLAIKEGVSPTLVRYFLEAVHGGESKPQVFMVAMPLNPKRCRGFQNTKLFAGVAATVSKSWPNVEVLDATRLVSGHNFYSARHMQAEGHEKFAKYLFAHLPPPVD